VRQSSRSRSYATIPQADLDDLRDRLARTRWTEELLDAGADYGVTVDYVRRLANHWLHDYDWRAWEDKLNAYPQFTTEIDGQNVHFCTSVPRSRTRSHSSSRTAGPGQWPSTSTSSVG
jgi:hypothetical protein